MSLHTFAQILILAPLALLGVALAFFPGSFDDRPREDEIDEFNDFRASLRKVRR